MASVVWNQSDSFLGTPDTRPSRKGGFDIFCQLIPPELPKKQTKKLNKPQTLTHYILHLPTFIYPLKITQFVYVKKSPQHLHSSDPPKKPVEAAEKRIFSWRHNFVSISWSFLLACGRTSFTTEESSPKSPRETCEKKQPSPTRVLQGFCLTWMGTKKVVKM